MSQVDLVGVVHIDKFWPAVREGFERALLKTGGDLTTGDLWTQCRSGSAFLVIVHEGETIVASAIVRSEVWQTGNKLRVLALYGEGAGNWFEDIMNMGRRIAADCGATSIIFEGRLGWQKYFPKAKVLRALYEEKL